MELVDEHAGDAMRMLTDKDPTTGEYRIPHIIYSDAYFSEMVAYADLVLPDTTYLERWDCISLLDRPIGSAEGPADAIRQPVLAPDRDVRPFQDVLIDLGARLKLPGFVKDDGSPTLPRLRRLHRQPRAHARHRPARRLARRGRRQRSARARRIPTSSTRYIENECFWRHHLPPEAALFQARQRGLSATMRKQHGPGRRTPTRSCCSSTASRCRSSASPPRATARCQPPETHRERIRSYFDPLPIWYPPLEDSRDRAGRLSAARDHPAPDR